MAAQTPKPKRRRERGDDGISWDKVNKCYVGTISLGYDDTGKRLRRFVRGKTKQEVKDKLNDLHEEIKAGIHTPATYTVKQCVMDWLDSLELDPHTMATYRGQAEKWIYPKIGAKKLAEFKATDADRFVRDVAKVLSKSSLVKIKSTLVRSIRRAQKYDLIGRNVAELVDLPQGQPGHPSRAMTEEQASKVLQAASGQPTGFVKVVKVSQGKYAATHAATETGELACGTWTRLETPVTEIDTDLAKTTCRFCRAELGLDADANANRRLEALFVLSITLGLRPGELRKLSWDHVDLDNAVVHVWRSASRTGDVKTAEVEALARAPQARRRRAPDAQEAPGRRTASRWHRVAGQQPRVLSRGRSYVHQRRAQLAIQQDDEAGRHRPLARPRGPPHGGVDHEQQRRPAPGDQRHRGPQVHSRDRDRLPARDRARHPRRSDRHGRRLRRRGRYDKTNKKTASQARARHRSHLVSLLILIREFEKPR